MDNCVCGIVSGFFLDYPFSYRQHFTPMPFQFYCPNGHLLQANENQIGQTCVCPHCQVEIIIPAPAGYTPASPATPPDAPTTQPPVSAFTGFNPQGQTAPSPMNLNIQKKKKKFDFGAASQESENAGQKPAQKMNIGDPDEDSRLHCLAAVSVPDSKAVRCL